MLTTQLLSIVSNAVAIRNLIDFSQEAKNYSFRGEKSALSHVHKFFLYYGRVWCPSCFWLSIS